MKKIENYNLPALEDKNIIIENLQNMGVDICQSGHIFDEHNIKQLWKKISEV